MATPYENYLESDSWREITEIPMGMIGSCIRIAGFTPEGDIDFTFSGELAGLQCDRTQFGEGVSRRVTYDVDLFVDKDGKGYKVPLWSKRTLWMEA